MTATLSFLVGTIEPFPLPTPPHHGVVLHGSMSKDIELLGAAADTTSDSGDV
jgi:hypothetical protein